MAVLSFKYYDHIVIFSTAFIGAYGVCRGISLFAGYFPTETDIYNLITNGTHIDLSWQFYLYLVGLLAILIGGIAFQWIQRGKDRRGNLNTKTD